MPEDVQQVILRCLEKDPTRRFADTTALEQGLAACGCAGPVVAGGRRGLLVGTAPGSAGTCERAARALAWIPTGGFFPNKSARLPLVDYSFSSTWILLICDDKS